MSRQSSRRSPQASSALWGKFSKFVSLRPERKVPRTLEGNEILNDPKLRAKAYKDIREKRTDTDLKELAS